MGWVLHEISFYFPLESEPTLECVCVFSVATTTIAGCDDDDDDGYDGQDALSRYNMHPTHMRGRECLFVVFFFVLLPWKTNVMHLGYIISL